MQNQTVLIKKIHKDAILPRYGTDYSAGCDLNALINENIVLEPSKTCIIPTGISVSIPSGYEIQIRSRSGLAAKNGIFVLNSPGTIDSDYIGEIKVILANFSNTNFVIENQMRIAQMVLTQYTKITFKEVNELEATKRGEGGFGSTGL